MGTKFTNEQVLGMMDNLDFTPEDGGTDELRDLLLSAKWDEWHMFPECAEEDVKDKWLDLYNLAYSVGKIIVLKSGTTVVDGEKVRVRAWRADRPTGTKRLGPGKFVNKDKADKSDDSVAPAVPGEQGEAA